MTLHLLRYFVEIFYSSMSIFAYISHYLNLNSYIDIFVSRNMQRSSTV